MTDVNASNLGIGVLLVAIGMVLGIYVLPIVDAAISDYADGADGVLGGASTDDPSDSNVTLLGLAPIVLIFAIILTGVGFLAVEGTKAVRSIKN